MLKLLFVGVSIFFAFFFFHVKTQAAETIISPVVLANTSSIQHTVSDNGKYKFETQEAWYIVNLEFQREDDTRFYFGGFISKASDEKMMGKWISGSIPKDKIGHTKNISSPEIVY